MKFIYGSMIVAIAIALLIVSPKFFVFSLVALMPAFVARVIDRLPTKDTSTSVALFNLTGLGFYAEDAFRSGGSFTNLAAVIDVQKLMVVYLFAALGWFIVWIVPRLTVIYIDYRNENRASRIRRKIDKLIDEWGAEVKN